MMVENGVDIWYFNKEKIGPVRDWMSFLSEDERSRVARFHFSHDQEAFALYHACKRIILSQYLSVSPHSVPILIGDNGKPFLQDNTLYFNLSHTKNLAVLAVTQLHSVGVDIESMDKKHEILSIAERFFHEKEVKALLSCLTFEDQTNCFYQLWTAKEALLKADGKGISAGLDIFYVCPNLLVDGSIMHSYSPEMTLIKLDCPDHYAASLAIMGETKAIEYRDITQILTEKFPC